MPDLPDSSSDKDKNALAASGRQEGEGVENEGVKETEKVTPRDIVAIKRGIVAMRQERWTAPIPHPDHFNKYPESVQNKMVEMMELEMQHRHDINKQHMAHSHIKIDAEIKQSKRGQHYALCIVLFVVSVSGWLVYDGHDEAVVFLVALIPALDPVLKRILKILNFGRKNAGKGDSDESQSGD